MTGKWEGLRGKDSSIKQGGGWWLEIPGWF